jgi:hypothetical protein
LLDALAAGDSGAYQHEVQIHAGKGHWMDLEDAVAVPWMAAFERDPTPERVVWVQDDVTSDSAYWLATTSAEVGRRATARIAGQSISVETDADTLSVLLSDALVDLERPVTLVVGGVPRDPVLATRTIANLATSLAVRRDPNLAFPARIEVTP